MKSETSGAQIVIRGVNSADPEDKVAILIDSVDPFIRKLSSPEQETGGGKSISMTMLDHSRISVRTHKDKGAEPTSMSVYAFTSGQPTERAIIGIPASGPERAEEALDRVFEHSRRNLKKRPAPLTFQPTPAQLEYLAQIESDTPSVNTWLTEEQYRAMPGVQRSQQEMAGYMTGMLEPGTPVFQVQGNPGPRQLHHRSDRRRAQSHRPVPVLLPGNLPGGKRDHAD